MLVVDGSPQNVSERSDGYQSALTILFDALRSRAVRRAAVPRNLQGQFQIIYLPSKYKSHVSQSNIADLFAGKCHLHSLFS